MTQPQTYLLSFAIFNLCLAIFNKPLSLLVLKFFAVGRLIQVDTKFKNTEKLLGIDISRSNPEVFNPTRKTARNFLLWTGIINTLGIAFMIFFFIPFVDKQTVNSDENTEKSSRQTKQIKMPNQIE